MISDDDNYVLITGATSGIGYQLTKVFAEHRYNLVIVARTEAKLDALAWELAQEYNIEVLPIPKDLFKREAPFEVYDEVKARGITVGILVNNAAQGLYGRFIETDLDKELDLLQLNIGAYLVFTKLYLQEMVDRGQGRILNVASIASKLPGPYQAVYHGSKSFIHSFTEAIRAETEGTGVTITSLLPGITDTDFFHKAHMENSKVLDRKLEDPAEVARDGFEALMKGEDMLISGFRYKAQIAASNLMPDHILARAMRKQQEPRK